MYLNVWPFIFNVMLFMEPQYNTFHGTSKYNTFHGMSNRDDHRAVQWNSSMIFYLKIDVFFYSCIYIYHVVRSNSLLENTKSLKASVGKRAHTHPFSKISPLLEIQNVPTFFRLIRKTKVLKDSFN